MAVFGPTTGNALAWKHIPNQKKVPVMGAIGSGTDITKPMRAGADNYMFRVGMVDREQVEGVIGYLKRNPKVKNVGFMIETTGYGQSALKDLEEVGAAQGVKAVAVEKFGVADTDMTSQLNKLKSAGVDTVVIWAQSTPIAHVFRSMEKINWFPLTLTSWAADNIAFYDTAGKTLSEKPFFLRTITDNRSPAQQKLYDRVSGQMTSPTAFGFLAHAYDGMHLMAMAVKQAGSTDGDKLRQALENLQGTYDGAMKTYTAVLADGARRAAGGRLQVGALAGRQAGSVRGRRDARRRQVSAGPGKKRGHHDGDVVAGARQRARRGRRVCAGGAGIQHHLHHDAHAEFRAWGVRVRGRVRRRGALFLLAGKPATTAAFTGLDLTGWQYLLAVAAALAMGLLGVLLYVFGVRPFAARPGMAWVMSTLGFGILLQSAAFAVWGRRP